MPSFGVLVFPGSNCDHDAYHAFKHVMGQDARFVWHKEERLGDVDAVVIPGGFSYGDYLRSGAIASFSPIMKDVIRFAEEGGMVIGICNGFQVLCEAKLLPGTLIKNESLRFACRDTYVRVERSDTNFTSEAREGQVLAIPVAHGEGRYFAESETIQGLFDENRVVFRYCTNEGEVTADANPNGSVRNIAGIINDRGNVLGMMPHPERCVESMLGSEDGRIILNSMISALERHQSVAAA